MAAPKIIPYDVELRAVNPVRSFDRPKAYTNDLNSVEFQFKVLDMTSTELTTATAVTLVYMRDGSFFANPSTDVSRVGNVFSYLLKENEGNHAGVAQIQLVVTVDGMELASQLFDFEIINGLETKVAQEVMIYDWTTLTRDAQDYIDQFVSNEDTRQQQFAGAQAQRGTTFGESEASRTTTFNASETGRTTTFNASEAGRTIAFNAAEEARATGYDADHSRAGTDHTTAVNDHTLAGTDHTTAVNDHTLAGTDHTRAEADHTRADADSASVAGFNTRLVAEEMATANNKISAVKGRTFADVDSRIEEIESDTSAIVTNELTNGDFTNGTNGWTGVYTNLAASDKTLLATTISNPTYNYAAVAQNTLLPVVAGDKYYLRATMHVLDAVCSSIALSLRGTTSGHIASNTVNTPAQNTPYTVSNVVTVDNLLVGNLSFRIQTTYADAAAAANKVIGLKYASLVNLTKAFGAGNEPTLAQMDALISKFANSWFDATRSIFKAKDALIKQLAIDTRLSNVELDAIYKVNNAIRNSNFASGTTYWSANSYGVLSVASNVASVTGNGTAAYTTILQPTEEDCVVGDIYYTMYRYSVHDNVCASINIFLRDSLNVGAVTNISVIAPRNGEIYQHSFTNRVEGNFSPISKIVSRIQANYADTTVSSGKVLKVYNAVLINLTKAFGKGNEPSAEFVDQLLSKFPSSWFDGSRNLSISEQILKKQVALDSRTEFEMRNALKNTDYLAGTTDWIPYADAITATPNGDYLEFTPTQPSGGMGQQYMSIAYHKYFFSFVMKDDVAATLSNGFSTEGVTAHTISSSVGTADTRITFVTSPTTSMNRIVFGKPSVTSNKLYLKKNAIVIDLTDVFGAGNEPTLAQMEAILTRLGVTTLTTKQIASIQDLYNVKANKKQEDWITPTLVNGWTEQSGFPVRYMKDEMGFVHLKGRIGGGAVGSYAFNLPAGYRTSELKHFPIPTSTAGTTTRGYTSTGSICPAESAYGTYVDISNISFRAEA